MLRYWLPILLTLAASAPAAADQQLFAMSVTQQRLGTCDTQTGAFAPVGSVGTFVQNIAFNPSDGYLYGYDFEDHQRLVRINPADATCVPLGPPITEFGWAYVHGLAYDSNMDRLIGTLAGSRDLLDIDPYTGTASLIGTMEEHSWALAYDPGANVLYGVTWGRSLVRIDVTDASQTLIGAPGSIGSVEGLTFDPISDLLYAVLLEQPFEDSLLATIEPETGTVSTIGPIASDDFISGLAFVPEPTTALLLACGGLLLRPRLRRSA